MKIYQFQVEIDSKTEEQICSKMKNTGTIEMTLSRNVDRLDFELKDFGNKIIITPNDKTKNGIDISKNISINRNIKLNTLLHGSKLKYHMGNSYEINNENNINNIKNLLNIKDYQSIIDYYWPLDRPFFTDKSLILTKKINISFRGDTYNI